MSLTHSHYCQHCDRTLVCSLGADCLLDGKTLRMGKTRHYGTRKTQGKVKSLPPNVSDISHLHDCPEAQRYREAVRNAMRDNGRGCRYGCSRLPCMHGATIRFPRVGASVPRAAETFEKPRNANEHVGEAIKAHGLYSQPATRRLRDWLDGRTIVIGYGIRSNRPDAERDAERDSQAERSDETTPATNDVRNSAIVAATSTAQIAAPTPRRHDETTCVNRRCEYCNSRYLELQR